MEPATPTMLCGARVYLPDAEGGLRVARATDGLSGELAAAGDGCVERAAAAGVPAIDSDGRSATLAIPCFRGAECRGVVEIVVDAGPGVRGAFEVWRRDDRGELGLTETWYGALDRLRDISRFVKFPRRAGLPGRVWDDRFPRVLGALADSKDFVRVTAARSERLRSALGVPFLRKSHELDALLVLLSAEASPIARATEVWARDPQSGRLGIVSADYGPYATLAGESRTASLAVGEGIAGRVFAREEPWMTADLLGVEFPRGERFVEYGFEHGVGLPVFVGADLVACVCLYP